MAHAHQDMLRRCVHLRAAISRCPRVLHFTCGVLYRARTRCKCVVGHRHRGIVVVVVVLVLVERADHQRLTAGHAARINKIIPGCAPDMHRSRRTTLNKARH